MADFYSDMKDFVSEILSPTSDNGLGQGNLTLTRTTPGTPDEDEPWVPVEPTVTTETLDGAVRGVDKRLVGTEAGSTVILASDLIAICTVPTMGYTAGDVLSVDGTPVHIISVERIPSAGVAAAVKFLIRG